MLGRELPDIRRRLGQMWFGRELSAAELGRALRLNASDPGKTVRHWETHRTAPISGPASAAIDTWLAGAPPPDPLSAIAEHW